MKRVMVRTHVLTDRDDILEVVKKYARPLVKPGDTVVVSESVVAITQGRAIPEEKIRPEFLARVLWRQVRKSPYGVGLRSPTSMQCAIWEVGRFRIVLGALLGGFTRLLGRRGDFYRIAGRRIALIDAAHTSPVEPFDSCVILGPEDPHGVAERMKEALGVEAAVMDINDIGGSWVIGATSGIDKEVLENLMRDNPMGQANELTPICIIKGGEKA